MITQPEIAQSLPYRGHVDILYPNWQSIDLHLERHGLPLCLILLILLQNAIEASQAEPYRIEVSFEANNRLIKVRDWGCGLPESVKHEFAQPPKVLDRTRTRGLGLVLARLLARELQWSLTPTVNLDRGTEFSLFMGNPAL